MLRPPDPDMRRAVTRQSDSPVLQIHLPCTANNKPEALDVQAEKLRRLYCFCHATAVTIASLAFAGCPR